MSTQMRSLEGRPRSPARNACSPFAGSNSMGSPAVRVMVVGAGRTVTVKTALDRPPEVVNVVAVASPGQKE
jgi:hypothetical protein